MPGVRQHLLTSKLLLNRRPTVKTPCTSNLAAAACSPCSAMLYATLNLYGHLRKANETRSDGVRGLQRSYFGLVA